MSAPKPFRARAFHGETFVLACVPLQYAAPLTGLAGAAVALRWQTDAMAADEWYEKAGEYDPATGELSALWGPDCDTGHDRVRFFLALTTPQGASFRAYGALDLAPSPGFTPAQILPESELDKLRDALQDEATARQKADNALETALQDHTKRCVPLLNPGERADPDTHGKTALVTQNGTQGGFAVAGNAGAAADAETFVTRYQRDAITVRGGPGLAPKVYKLSATGNAEDETVAQIQDVSNRLDVHNANKDAHQPMQDALKALIGQKADTGHTHATAQITGLDAALAAKADAADVYTKAEVDGKVSGVYHYKGSVATRSALPQSPAVGDVYNVQDEDGQNVAWTGSAWDALGATVDLSAYSTAEQTNAAIQANVQQAYNALSQAIVQAAAPKANAEDVYAKTETYTKAEVQSLIAEAVAAAKTQLLAQLEGLYAPLASVQATVGGTTYRWAWDDTFQTFAMKQVSE